MANNLYPLVYKPGVKKDGTTFQADYCTTGEWIRFQRGNIRKMGGMKAFNDPDVRDLTRVTNLTIVPSSGTDTNIIVYITPATGEIKRYYISQDFEKSGATVTAYNIPQNLNLLWKSQIVIQGDNQRIVFVGASSFLNINDNSVSTLLIGNLDGNNFNLAPFPVPPVNLKGVSGALFVNPYLFLYGSNGLLQWSDDRDITKFSGGNSSTINVNTDKIIDMKAIRGGVNSPTLLCWTLTSVVRLINVGNGAVLDFRRDVLSDSSSILSSRSVVEYDGVFFWPGTTRFFQYTGVVQKLANTINQNYFFNNLDLNNRQLVCGVKQTQYDEIWWFYPAKGQNQQTVRNNRAIIYNIVDNAWYDTPIERDAGVYSEAFGFMATYGGSVTTPNTPLTIYRHEYETFVNPNARDLAIQEYIPDGAQGATRRVPIPSTFTTPTISWAAFNPMKQLTGVDRWMTLFSIEPDFVLAPDNSDMTVRVEAREFAQSVPVVSNAVIIQDKTVANFKGKTDLAIQGKHLTLIFSSRTNFEMGHVLVLLGIGDGR
jgi:hypothetical protein